MAERPVKVDVDAEARGIVLALQTMEDGGSALDLLDGQRCAVCRQAWRALGAATPSAREEILSGWRAEVERPLPAGLERLHPTWLLAALEGEPADLVRLVLRALPDPLRVLFPPMPSLVRDIPTIVGESTSWSLVTTPEVLRLAFGWLAPLCESACGPNAESLCTYAFEDLLFEITRQGARAVGQSLAGASPALRARAMAGAGEPWAEVIREAAALDLSRDERRSAMGHANAKLPNSARSPGERLLHIGLSVLESELVADHPDSIYRVAGRLPAAIGKAWLGW